MAPHVPQSPPALLPGRSARYWARVQAVTGFTILVVPIGWPLISLFPGIELRTVLLIVTGAVSFVVGILGTFYAIVQRTRRARLEAAAGYTTLAGVGIEYWQLDPNTGDVLRRPGERQARKRSSG